MNAENNTAKNTEKKTIKIASVLDDSGTGGFVTVEMTEAEEKRYNDGMSRLAEIFG